MATIANPRYVPRHLTARELVIDFLSNRYPREMSVQEITGVGIALGFTEQSLRMALTRLVEQSVAANTGRGRYRLSPSGEAMRDEVRKWRHLDDLAKPWSGAWIGVFDASVPRSDRAALRRHERAMRLRGFRELQSRSMDSSRQSARLRWRNCANICARWGFIPRRWWSA